MALASLLKYAAEGTLDLVVLVLVLELVSALVLRLEWPEQASVQGLKLSVAAL